VRAMLIRPAVTKIDGGGGLRWLEPIVVAAFVHMGGGFIRVNFGLISLDLVLGGQMQ
jgi:hypothetical protein